MTIGSWRGHEGSTEVPSDRVCTVMRTFAVVICAYTEDRWDQIVLAVDSVRSQVPTPDRVILVIDHNEALLHQAQAAFPQVTVTANNGPKGLSGARNTGAFIASTDIVGFLDDDAVALPGWTAGILAHFDEPSTSGVGTKVLPNWQGKQPKWFPLEFLWVVGCSYVGLPDMPANVRNPIGASMAFRRLDILDAGGFDASVGRVGANPLGCEETELSIRIGQLRPMSHIRYDPSVSVTHLVPPAREQLSYFVKRCWAEGQSKARVRNLTKSTKLTLSSEREYVRRVLPRAIWTGLGTPPWGWVRGLVILLGTSATVGGFAWSLWGRAVKESVNGRRGTRPIHAGRENESSIGPVSAAGDPRSEGA